MTQSGQREISLGHSPDADDAFMFYALVAGKLPSGAIRFRQEVTDIESLNELARNEAIDLTAVSIHAYGFLRDNYWLLPCGGSMGEGYGPRVVSAKSMTREELSRARIAIPGRKTSAVMALSLYLGIGPEKLPLIVRPFDRILDSVRSGEAEAGLVIHEGQLTYADEGLALCVDLGHWWKEETGLPLPLGGNALRKTLGIDLARECARLLRESIRWGLQHRSEALQYAAGFSRGLSTEKLDQFVEMYANERTFDYGTEGRQAIELFLRRGREIGMLPASAGVDWLPE
ncbi:menaquinone biosynthesis family protein [Methylacidimicrobium tartarophylax]|uniref:1,4-dihydroxy-6-naphtoate synthase n=1 Tax=Methylacidimicrobium tartarophylax TaxID=1041768 RepID=A0A5E6M5D6_9BACT|nr:MqnA/MqnD/SBP family protein [Methylacidimicrobium tartarophylax]VVM04783.1 1,4-dihydroxy-6-naphthoate synthase [Methylacidimicrobium tartarophylax]